MRENPYFKKLSKILSMHITRFKIDYPEIKLNKYPDDFELILEKYIEVNAHAFCMDVQSERKKMANIIIQFLKENSV